MMKVGAKLLLIFSFTLFTSSAYAYSPAVKDLEDLPSAKTYSKEVTPAFDQSHWVYKSLKSISQNHGFLVDLSDKTFDGSKPLTRNEAALLLVNLVGKIDQNNLKLNDVEQIKLEILKEELKQDTQRLAGRVTNLETDVQGLKGSVSNLEKNNQKTLKVNFGDNLQLNGGIIASYTGVLDKGTPNPQANFNIPLLDFGLSGILRPGLEYRGQFYPQTAIDSTKTTPYNMMGDVYVATDKIAHHKIYFGRTRVPIGVEGTRSAYGLLFTDRAQIARKFSNVRDLGIKDMGSWKYMDYSLGIYNGTRANTDNNTSLDIASWVSFKPLVDKPQYGSLLLGGGYTVGENIYNYNIFGTHMGYKYKKFGFDTEYSRADGTDGLLATRGKNAQGTYFQSSYDVTPKLQLAARYDTFNPYTELHGDSISSNKPSDEYTLGLNYFLDKSNVKFQLNYVYINNAYSTNDSQRVVLQSQYNTW
jgi:hypothetical protein